MELILIGLLFGGGIACAAILLLCATFLSKSLAGRGLLALLAMISLAVQGGCWHLAAGIGRATGGTGDNGTWSRIMVFASIAAVAWSAALIFSAKLRPPATPDKDSPRSEEG